MKYTYGIDTEAFIYDTKNKEIVSSIGIIPGTKKRPFKLNNCMIQKDNVLIEWNTKPVDNEKDWNEQIKLAEQDVISFLKLINPDYELLYSPIELIDPKYLKHPDALRFGCDPDFCAWTKHMNKPPMPKPLNARSTGFHIHIGGKFTEEQVINLSKAFDKYVTIPILTNMSKSEKCKECKRRELYGRAGCYRIHNIEEDGFEGIEYRSLSGPCYKMDLFKRMQQALEHIDEKFPKTIQKEINEGVL
jgi:hypothetical protein